MIVDQHDRTGRQLIFLPDLIDVQVADQVAPLLNQMLQSFRQQFLKILT